MIKLSEIASDENSEHYNKMRAYGWLWHAQKHGADINPQKLDKAKINAGPAADFIVPDSPIYRLSKRCYQP